MKRLAEWARMRCGLIVIAGMVLVTPLSTLGAQAEQPGAQADQPQLSGEFLEFLGEIDSAEITGFDPRQFDELYQMLKNRIKDMIETVNQQKLDKNKTEKENDHDTIQKN